MTAGGGLVGVSAGRGAACPRSWRTRAVALAVLVVGGVTLACAPRFEHDLLLRGGRVLDGAGNPWRRADVAIRNGRIAAIGLFPEASARRVIDLGDRYVAPGFIDVHSHAGPALATPGLSHARPLLAQGITTVVINPDGGGAVDLVAQRQELLRDGLGVHVVQLVPHGSVRAEVMGAEDRAPSAEELEQMQELVRHGMEAGAFGLSSGLYYAPGSFAATEEVIALAEVIAPYGGLYSSHIRDEADYSVGLQAAVTEVVRIAREAEVTGVVTHIKALGPRVWGLAEAIVNSLQQARDEGVAVYADQYPYEASGTSILGALIPRWAQVGGREKLQERLDDADQRARVRSGILENLDRRGGAEKLQVQRHQADPSVEGRTLAAVAAERALHAADLALEMLEAGGAGLVSFNMSEEDVETFMRPEWTMTSSDGGLVALGEGVPHPRYYGTFPRKIRKYVGELGVLSLAQAVRSMTSLPAAVLGLGDRGVLRAGAVADLVVFDLERLRDVATYDDPHHYAEGVELVVVGGEIASEAGDFSDELHGVVLRRR